MSLKLAEKINQKSVIPAHGILLDPGRTDCGLLRGKMLRDDTMILTAQSFAQGVTIIGSYDIERSVVTLHSS